MKIFSMYDRKAQFYVQPFAESSTVAALRGFEVAVNDTSKGESTFRRFPDDFELHELASFDPQTGELLVCAPVINLGSARTVLKNAPHQMDLPQAPRAPKQAELADASRPN